MLAFASAASAQIQTPGGGAPGPVKQMNGEIYYPPYLFKRDGSGDLATRPTLVEAPATVNPKPADLRKYLREIINDTP